ncbi:PilN domain-containing protein [Desulfobacterales bacterium HSG2]|nr:PilN domain-containing protein [Desulfobacterales bacterium HSG2]
MIRINLLPYRDDRIKKEIRKKIFIFLLSLVGVVIILGFIYIHLDGQIKSLKKDIQKAQKDLDKYNKIVEKVEKLREKLAAVNKKLAVIKTLDMNRYDAVHLLDTMTKTVIKKRMWFTSFEAIEKVTITKKKITVEVEVKGKKKKKKKTVEENKVEVIIEIRGIALDNKTVADFMTRLKNARSLSGTEMFSNIKLVTLYQEMISQGKDKPGINLKGFEVKCLKVPLELSNKKNKKKKS